MKCAGIEECGKCIEACSKRAISPGQQAQQSATQKTIRHIRIDRAICNNCGDCAAACSRKALYLCGTDYTVEDLVKRVARDIPFYDQSGGGVTISGGEPLCQPEFVRQLLQALKSRGIHTALDTCGYVGYAAIEAALPFTDLFLYDLKHMDSSSHKTATGVPNELILENASKIARAGGKMQVRIPVIPLFNDSDDNIRKTGQFCRSLGEAVTLVQLLPYHNLGVMKYQRIYDGKTVLEAEPPSDDRMQELKALLESLGLPVTVH